jgi:hypothetical protein
MTAINLKTVLGARIAEQYNRHREFDPNLLYSDIESAVDVSGALLDGLDAAEREDLKALRAGFSYFYPGGDRDGWEQGKDELKKLLLSTDGPGPAKPEPPPEPARPQKPAGVSIWAADDNHSTGWGDGRGGLIHYEWGVGATTPMIHIAVSEDHRTWNITGKLPEDLEEIRVGFDDPDLGYWDVKGVGGMNAVQLAHAIDKQALLESQGFKVRVVTDEARPNWAQLKIDRVDPDEQQGD